MPANDPHHANDPSDANDPHHTNDPTRPPAPLGPIGAEVAVRSWRRAPLAAVAWLTPDGTPDLATVFPLTDGDRPVLALPYAQLALARALETSTELILSVTHAAEDAEVAAITVRGRAEVTADPRGEVFHDAGLIDMELRKYPSSRRRLDSLLLRREHWWFLPRLIVRIAELHEAQSFAPHDALLATGGTRLEVGPCHLDARDPLVLRAGDRPPGRVPAAVLEHGGDLPALERPWEQRWLGTLDGNRFETSSVTGGPEPDRALTLLQRIRAERRLERACRDGLREAGHA
jgi:hypothetical protein